MSVVGNLHQTAIEVVCTGGTKLPHKPRYHVAWVVEDYPGSARSPVGGNVERTRHGWRLRCGYQDRYGRRCHENRPVREAAWRLEVAKAERQGRRTIDISGMR